MCDFGEGAYIRVPIKIFSRYEGLNGQQNVFAPPVGWAPQIAEAAQLDIDAEDEDLNANATNMDYAINNLGKSQVGLRVEVSDGESSSGSDDDMNDGEG